MTGFGVDRDRLADLVRQLARCGADLRAVEAEVEARVKQLHVVWQGEAATLHTHAHRRWTVGARQTHEALEDLRAIAQTADDNYGAAIAANAAMWCG